MPLRAILTNRHIGSNGACPVCKQGAEDIRHLLFLCTSARDLWASLGLTQLINQALAVDRSGSAIFEFIFSLPDQQLAVHKELNFKQAIAVGGWYLWWLRRRVTHNESIPPMCRWPFSVLSVASNYQRVADHTRIRAEPNWCKPAPRFLKLNVDAAYYPDEGVGATAAIIRDEKGKYLGA